MTNFSADLQGRAPIKLLDDNDLAARWNMSRRTLQNWRVSGKGPAFIKLGRNVRYTTAEVEKFEQNAMAFSTSMHGGSGAY